VLTPHHGTDLGVIDLVANACVLHALGARLLGTVLLLLLFFVGFSLKENGRCAAAFLLQSHPAASCRTITIIALQSHLAACCSTITIIALQSHLSASCRTITIIAPESHLLTKLVTTPPPLLLIFDGRVHCGQRIVGGGARQPDRTQQAGVPQMVLADWGPTDATTCRYLSESKKHQSIKIFLN
jgi:hypothetical protein